MERERIITRKKRARENTCVRERGRRAKVLRIEGLMLKAFKKFKIMTRPISFSSDDTDPARSQRRDAAAASRAHDVGAD